KLAGISLDMKPAEVIALLGDPTAILMAQPPIITRTAGTGVGGAMAGLPGTMENMIPEADRPNTLVLIYGDQEIEIGTSGGALSAAIGPLGFGEPAAAGGGGKAEIPVWAYVVRATTLSLGQQELIYKINDTYSLGVTITGAGKEAKVTDVVACSFESFKTFPSTPTRLHERKAVNFFYNAPDPSKRRQLPAGTSKGIVIGSRLDEVLMRHGWPQVFFPYVSDPIAKIVLARPEAKIPTVPVKPGAGAGAGMASAPVSPTGMLGPNVTASGEKPAMFTDGDKFTMSTGFSKNALMLFLNDNVALTLVDFTVVRIQIGSGVVRPPDPPRIAPATPGAMP
ncbi:MAG TPA: hypothetical protein PLZ36_13265, partial [Armatimonadota bacterium]|nr:hypothetical protein [Armatimonadota bacterium]